MTKPRDVDTARSMVLDQARRAKADVVHRLESGDRNWDELRSVVNRYIEMQTASDVLSGQITLESVGRR